MVLNFIEDRVDGWKLLHAMRRPWPQQAEDIGSWYAIFNIVSVIGILFNGGIMCYTMDLLEDQTPSYRIGAFLLFCFVCFSGRALSLMYVYIYIHVCVCVCVCVSPTLLHSYTH